MSNRYASIVTRAGLEHCRGIRNGFYCHEGDHDEGFWTPGVVHISDKRWSWTTAHRIVKLAALAADPTLDTVKPHWRRRWLINLRARDIGAKAHVKVPAKYIAYDRAYVLAAVRDIPNTIEDRKRAFDWARRG